MVDGCTRSLLNDKGKTKDNLNRNYNESPLNSQKGWVEFFRCALHVIMTSLSLHLTVREDRSVVPLQNGLYQRRPTDFIYPLLGRPVPENGVEEEALRGFPRISPRVTHDDFSPVFLCLSDAASPIQQSVKMRGESRR